MFACTSERLDFQSLSSFTYACTCIHMYVYSYHYICMYIGSSNIRLNSDPTRGHRSWYIAFNMCDNDSSICRYIRGSGARGGDAEAPERDWIYNVIFDRQYEARFVFNWIFSDSVCFGYWFTHASSWIHAVDIIGLTFLTGGIRTTSMHGGNEIGYFGLYGLHGSMNHVSIIFALHL